MQLNKVCLFACMCFGFSVAQLFLFSINQPESFSCVFGTHRIILEVIAGVISEGGIELDTAFLEHVLEVYEGRCSGLTK